MKSAGVAAQFVVGGGDVGVHEVDRELEEPGGELFAGRVEVLVDDGGREVPEQLAFAERAALEDGAGKDVGHVLRVEAAFPGGDVDRVAVPFIGDRVGEGEDDGARLLQRCG